jgi:geranylgeranyl pyrophosphate synthase
VVLINQIGHYIVGSGGKRLRPLLVLLAAKACGYSGYRHLDMAAIVEFIHTATLLHDDVVDGSELRRNRDTANAVWGNEASVLVGDFLYSRAFEMMVDVGLMRVMDVLSSATNRIAEGEVLQLMNTHDPDTDESRYMEVIKRKTATLFEAGTRLGAVLSEVPPELEEQIASFGMHLGVAFQLVDDALDYESDSATIGKHIGDDLEEGKPTLPVIRAMAGRDRRPARDAAQGDRGRRPRADRRCGRGHCRNRRADIYCGACQGGCDVGTGRPRGPSGLRRQACPGGDRGFRCRPDLLTSLRAEAVWQERFPAVRLVCKPGGSTAGIRALQRRIARNTLRGVAQPGRALSSGGRGRRFESFHPDHISALAERRGAQHDAATASVRVGIPRAVDNALSLIGEVIPSVSSNIKLSRSAVGRAMAALGFGPQRPLRRARERDPVLVERWEREDYPAIAAEAKRVGARVFFGDEAGMRSDHHAGTTWAPIARTPTVPTTGQRFGLNMLSAVAPDGRFCFMVYEGRVTA